MTVFCEKFTVSTKGFDDLIDITQKVQNIVALKGAENGLVNVSVTASTASLTTLESEPGLAFDLPRLLDNIVPLNRVYQHDNNWHDGNAFAHLKAVLLGNFVTLPISDKKIEMTNWQKIVLIDFDNKPRIRQIVVTILN